MEEGDGGGGSSIASTEFTVRFCPPIRVVSGNGVSSSETFLLPRTVCRVVSLHFGSMWIYSRDRWVPMRERADKDSAVGDSPSSWTIEGGGGSAARS